MGQPLKIMIAMPCAQGAAKMQAVSTVAKTCIALTKAGHDTSVAVVEIPDITLARNYLASMALAEGADKLLFIDNDMRFSPSVTMKLLNSGKDVIGAGAPKRGVSIERLIELARAKPDASVSKVFSSALAYNLRRRDRSFTFEDGVAEVEGIGMAATLIDAKVLRDMIAAGTARPLPRTFGAVDIFGFFDPFDLDGKPLSEDLSFCERWRSMGGKVYALDSAGVGHVGSFTYEGSFIEAMTP